MKISNKIPNPIQNSAQNAEAAKTSKSAGAGALLDSKQAKSSSKSNELGGAQVDLSTRAQQMAKAKELATPSQEIDEAKVARLQKLIDEGKYNIDADAIAGRLLDEHMKMPR